MAHRLAPALLTPLFAMLAACEGAGAGGALDLVLDTPRRCAHCGRIESKEEIPREVADPRAGATYEYKVRMADGSRGVFREKASPSWRVGERLIFIGRTDRPSTEKSPPGGEPPNPKIAAAASKTFDVR
jgi:hypothetical protein